MAVIYAKPKPLDKKLTAKEISWALGASWHSPYEFRKQFAVVPNVTTLLPWEADLVSVSHSGLLTEIEIKVSASDWKNDAGKDKWIRLQREQARPELENWGGPALGWALVKYFWYAAPLPLAQRWQQFKIPDFAGVYGVEHNESEHAAADQLKFKVLRPAAARPGHRKLTPQERLQLARLGAMRIWSKKPMEDVTNGRA